MPRKNTLKMYVDDAYYHVYNRGTDKRNIYEDEEDHRVFLGYLKEYLSPAEGSEPKKVLVNINNKIFQGTPRKRKNYYENIELVAYCLMPNHFHLLIKQTDKEAMSRFLRSLLTRYSMYFNKKYNRVGKLFEGPYKAVLIDNDSYLLYLTRYIHKNPGKYKFDLTKAYSSYAEYLGIRKTPWIKPNLILSQFYNKKSPEIKKFISYEEFVEGKIHYPVRMDEYTIEQE